MERLNRSALPAAPRYAERVLQIGEGRFLRGFADWVVQRMNEQGLFQGSVVVAAPRPSGGKHIDQLNEQDGLYTVWLQGLAGGETVDDPQLVTAISRGINPAEDWPDFLRCAENPEIRFILSNTTEAGLVYQPELYPVDAAPASFPAKLTAFLYHRYQRFAGDGEAGVNVLPCELLDNNGELLRGYVRQHASDWALPDAFSAWMDECVRFCNTLVDRIVTGYPEETEAARAFAKLGYRDELLTVAEPFHLWVIEGDDDLRRQWPAAGAGLNVHIVPDVTPYRLRKVRILNGAHTALFAPAFLSGLQTVGEAMADDTIGAFACAYIEREVIPTVRGAGGAEYELRAYAETVFERFRNPFVRHQLQALALGGLAKIKARLVPTMTAFAQTFGAAPPLLCATLACHLIYYRNAERAWELADNPDLLAPLQAAWTSYHGQDTESVAARLLALEALWGADLRTLPGVVAQVAIALDGVAELGAKEYLRRLR